MTLKLMIPGPVEVEDEVLTCMGGPVRAHYGDEWIATYSETLNLLRQVLMTRGKVFILPGSGTLGNDAAVQSLFAPGDKVVVGVNGFFGKRLVEIAQANLLNVEIVEAQPGELLSPADFERAFATDPAIVAALVVHLETSTAVLNPIREIAAVTRKFNRLLMVDGVSSIGGAAFDMDGWGVDVVGTAPQKGLGAPPGLGIVALGERAWERITGQPERLHSWYLDLRRWNWYAENWGSWHPTPVTMPTSLILALRASLQSLVAESVPARLRRYTRLAERLRTELEFLGFPLFVPRERMAPVLTAARCPDGVTSHEVIRYLAGHHNIQITAGFGAAKDSVIRIGHMGGAVNDEAIDAVLDGLSEFAQMRALNALMPL